MARCIGWKKKLLNLQLFTWNHCIPFTCRFSSTTSNLHRISAGIFKIQSHSAENSNKEGVVSLSFSQKTSKYSTLENTVNSTSSVNSVKMSPCGIKIEWRWKMLGERDLKLTSAANSLYMIFFELPPPEEWLVETLAGCQATTSEFLLADLSTGAFGLSGGECLLEKVTSAEALPWISSTLAHTNTS